MREAFSDRAGMPEDRMFGDASMLRARWRLHPDGAVVARVDGEVAGSALSMRWGSVGVFGPLSVTASKQRTGVGRALLAATLERMDAWGLEHAGLFTWSDSPGHLALYRAAGFWPRHLALLMAKPLLADAAGHAHTVGGLTDAERPGAAGECAELAGEVRAGLDLTREVLGLPEHGFGDTVLLEGDGVLDGFATLHLGAGSEAGTGHCLVKFAAARPGAGAPERFAALLEACERFAAAHGAFRLEAMCDAGRVGACRALLDRGFVVAFQGVNLHRDARPGYDGPDDWVADDWR